MNKELTISCELKYLSEMRDFIKKNLTDLDIKDVEIQKIVLAVDEICANLIIHANNSNPDKKLNVCVDLSNKKELKFTIKDYGKPFDLSTYKPPSMTQIVSEKRKGSLGLILVNRIMDEINFKKKKNCNICVLKKKI